MIVKSEPDIKKEDDLLRLPPNVPRKVVDLSDPNVLVTIRHRDGTLCHSKKSYAFYNQLPPPRPDELPDLPNSPRSDAVTTESRTPSMSEIKENELRNLLDIPNRNDSAGVVNTDNSSATIIRNEASGDVNTKNREGNSPSNTVSIN